MEAKEFIWDDTTVKEYLVFRMGKPAGDDILMNQFKASKQRKPFKTYDGKNFYEGDNIYVVFTQDKYGYPIWEAYYWACYAPNNWDETVRIFRTKEVAQSYIAENEKRYSVKDVREAFLSHFPNLLYTEEQIISELQKKK